MSVANPCVYEGYLHTLKFYKLHIPPYGFFLHLRTLKNWFCTQIKWLTNILTLQVQITLFSLMFFLISHSWKFSLPVNRRLLSNTILASLFSPGRDCHQHWYCCCTYTSGSLWKVWGWGWQLCVQSLGQITIEIRMRVCSKERNMIGIILM
jgi:hypothetical protein